MVDALIVSAENPNITESSGNTPIHFAAMEDTKRIWNWAIEHLLLSNPNNNLIYNYSLNAIMIALIYFHTLRK